MQAAVSPNGQATGVLSPLQHPLMVPEILIIILSFATRSTLASAARVSKAWSSIALDQLWSGHDVKVPDLLQVLPLTLYSSFDPPRQTWGFAQDPTEEEWARFRSYALRVRSLVFPYLRPVNVHYDPRITEWKVEKDVRFPRLRRIEAHLGPGAMSLSQLRSFITPGLRELYLEMDKPGLVLQSLIDDLATSEGLHLQKLKLYDIGHMLVGSESGDAVANFSVANESSIEALELSGTRLNASLTTGHSLLNLRALSFTAFLLGDGGRDKHPIQVLVEGCPHVAYFRTQLDYSWPATNILNLPGLRMILTWHLLSFEVELGHGVHFTEADLEEMGRAWPKLKKLNLIWNRGTFKLPFSRLADIVSTFPQLEELAGLFCYEEEEETLLPTYQLLSEQGRPSRLRKLWLGSSHPPESERERDIVAPFLARILPPGLRIHREYYLPYTQDRVELENRDKAAATGRDLNPKWDALFRQIEELQGGVRIWFGNIPEDSNGVWF